MKQIKTIRNLVVVALIALMTNFSYAQKVELESLNIINSDLRIEGGNLIIKENATVTLNSKINITGGNKDEFKVKIVFYGVDDNMKEITATAEYTYSKKSTTNGNNISLKLPPHTNIRIASVAHFVDDWQGETAYMSVNDRTTWTKKSKIVLMLNGIAKPLNNGVCQYGRCFCIEGSQGNDCASKEIIKFDSMVISQTIKKNKENDYTLWIETGFNQTHNQTGNKTDIPTLDQLVAWGELEAFITTEITDAKGKKETYTIPCDLSSEKGVCLFNGQKSLVNPADGAITAVICHFRTAPGAQFGISSASLYLRNKTAFQKPSSDNFTWTETWVSKKEDYHLCHQNELSASFMDYKENDKSISVLIGLNNSKTGEPSDFEKKLSQRELTTYGVITWVDGNGKTFDERIEAFETKEGLWQYKTEIAQSKAGEPKVTMAQLNLYATNKCQTTYKYTSVYKKDLNSKKPWDYKVIMNEMVAYDNPIFVPVNGSMNNILALTVPSTVININGGNFVISDNAKFTVGLSNLNIGKNIGKHKIGRVHSSWNKVNEVLKSGDVIKTVNKNYTFTHEWNEKTMQYEALVSFGGSEKAPAEISEILITIVMENKDTFIYTYEGKYGTSLDNKTLYLELKKTEKNKYDDPCKTKYKLKEIDFAELNVSNLYSLLFKFNLEEKSDVPENVEMVVELKNCEGTAQKIKIRLKYDAKSETYIGAQTIPQIQNCRWDLNAVYIGAHNACNEITLWTFDPSKVKARGSGWGTTAVVGSIGGTAVVGMP
jgi:hypothetical protein